MRQPAAISETIPDTHRVLVSFTIPGPPRGKERARPGLSPTGKKIFYTPAKTKAYERYVRQWAMVGMARKTPVRGACIVSAVLRFEPPKSATKARRAAMLAGQIPHIVKPDADNCLKALLDGMNKIVFADDAQVTRAIPDKIYAEKPGADITVWAIPENQNKESAR